MKTTKDVITENIKLIENLSQKTFKDHVVTLRHRSSCGKFASWRCKNPVSWAYGFDISIEPGRLMVFGDIGTCVWERTENMLEWAKESIESIDYFAEKVVNEIVTKEFSAEKAKAWVNETFLEKRKEQQKFDEEWLKDNPENDELINNNEDEELKQDLMNAIEEGCFEHVLFESGLIDGCDFPNLKIWKPGFLWSREAVKFFLNNKGEI